MRDRVVIRCPLEWEGRTNSAWVESRLQDFYADRPLLPEDPGSDSGRVSLSLARKPLRVFCALLDQPVSSSLRRLIAGYSDELPARREPRALPVNTLLAPERRVIDVEPQVRRALPAPTGQKIARASDGALLDVRTAQRLWEPDGRWPETHMDQRGNMFRAPARKPKPFPWIELAFAVLAVVLILVFALRRPGVGQASSTDLFKPWVPTR